MTRPWHGLTSGGRATSDHLGDRVTALADGALDHGARDRALRHVADCADCLRRLEQERRTKARLATLAHPPVPPDLTLRLLAVPEAPLRPPAAGGVGNGWTPYDGSVAAARPGDRPGDRPADRPVSSGPPRRARRDRPAARRPRRRSRRVARFAALTSGLLSVAGVAALGTVYAVGAAAPSSGPGVFPSVATVRTGPSVDTGSRAARWSPARPRQLSGGSAMHRFGGILQPVDLAVTGRAGVLQAPGTTLVPRIGHGDGPGRG